MTIKLRNSNTTEIIRAATFAEWQESINSGEEGHIDVDGVTCYVDGNPDRVAGGESDDADVGRVKLTTKGEVLVVWDSGVTTWTPVTLLAAGV